MIARAAAPAQFVKCAEVRFVLAALASFAYGLTQDLVVQRVALLLLELYRKLLSPLLPGACRFEPSCSRYATGCIEAHGVLRGSALTFLRLCKCHPFHPGGYDPPPAAPLPR